MPITLGDQNITSSTGNLGIGAPSPSRTLHVLGESTNNPNTCLIQSSDDTTNRSLLRFADPSTTSIPTQPHLGSNGDNFVIYAGDQQRLRITPQGSVDLASGGAYTFNGSLSRRVITIPHTGLYSSSAWLRIRDASGGHPYQDKLSIVGGVNFGTGTGTSGAAPDRQWYVFDRPSTPNNTVVMYFLEIASGGWNYGQRVTHASFIITCVQTSAVVHQVSGVNLGGITVTAAVQNYFTSNGRHRIAIRNTQGLNLFKYAISLQGGLFDSFGNVSTFETNSNPL